MRYWNGHDHRRAALFCISGENEILDSKDSRDSGRVPAQVRTCAHGLGVGSGLLRKELKKKIEY